jgi:hypothetical protein
MFKEIKIKFILDRILKYKTNCIQQADITQRNTSQNMKILQITRAIAAGKRQEVTWLLVS